MFRWNLESKHFWWDRTSYRPTQFCTLRFKSARVCTVYSIWDECLNSFTKPIAIGIASFIWESSCIDLHHVTYVELLYWDCRHYHRAVMWSICNLLISFVYKTSTIVFNRTRVYQMQPRNNQNWYYSVGKYVHQNQETAEIAFCTSLKSISISGFVDTRDKVNAD